ncbi:hypothetical protein JOD29_000824 [Lysinibacillus composti]|uniref:DUF2577 domain-containing protein n=1 Tax=Lysinibacillus composti TaxID=720633 RepID=A0A3N9UIX9_9BACI|nr:DUF2577 family protein [Lysinibacillus composti]MBM7607580.1 hypothetical protein [Lysinibacillus composti]RQW75915.1 DUF2577 domain-containing protein [Lysinibacillus composti]
MNDPLVEFASLFKERENKTQEPFVIGTVIDLSPLTINDGENILLTSEDLIMASGLQASLIVGNKVIMIPSNSLNLYAVICKVG